jgi:hypothetical protein
MPTRSDLDSVKNAYSKSKNISINLNNVNGQVLINLQA